MTATWRPWASRLTSAASSAGGRGFIVEEVETTTKAERVVVLVVKGLALSLGPKVVRVLRYDRPSRWRCRLRDERIWLHLAELSGSEAGPSVREREGAVTSFIDGDCHAVEHRSLAVPSLSRFHHVNGEVVQSSSRRGERVSLSVELFGDRTYKPKVDALLAEVAGDFLDSEHVGLGHDASVDHRPELGVRALRRRVAVEDALESVHHGLVVHVDVHRPLGARCEMDNGQGLGNLSVLCEAVHSRTIVHAMLDTVVDTVSGSS